MILIVDIKKPNSLIEFNENSGSDALGDVDVSDVMMVEKPKNKRKRVILCQFCVSPDCWLLAASSHAGLSNLSHCLSQITTQRNKCISPSAHQHKTFKLKYLFTETR